MEPLRGGRLVNIPEKAKKVFEENERKETPAAWSFRWLWNQPEVTCVLSGMNSEEMIVENVKTASLACAGEFTEEDNRVIEKVKEIIREKEMVNCTGCRYCMPCPKGVDIPGNFYYYNLMYMESKKHKARFEFVQNICLRKEAGIATQCIGCGKCEQHCPQHINIREKLKEADRNLRPAYYKPAIKIVRKFFAK